MGVPRHVELCRENLSNMDGNIDHAVMQWARENAMNVPLGKIVELIQIVQSIAKGHARDVLELGTNATRIDKTKNQ